MSKFTIVLLLSCVAFGYYKQPIVNLVPPNYPLTVRTSIRHLESVVFEQSFEIAYSESQPKLEKQVPLPFGTTLASNLTIQVQLLMSVNGIEQVVTEQTRNLTRYQSIRKQEEESSFRSYDPMDEIQQLAHSTDTSSDLSTDPNHQEEYCTHLPQEFHIMFVVNHMAFTTPITPQYRLELVERGGRVSYRPPLDLSQLYLPTTHSRPLQSNSSVTLQIFPMSYQSYLMFYSLGHLEQLKQDLGPLAEYFSLKEEWLDEFKEFFFMNPPWLIALYYILSLAQIILKMATIKSEFLFWKNIDQNKGISLKTLFFQLGADVILILYLYQYKASTLILIFHALDILITLWKITRTYSVQLTTRFPFLRLATSELYKQREQIDTQSVWYMNYLLFPLMGCYLFYALYSRAWKIPSWYRFVLDTAVAFIALFGFILMTPQLYINYKLKSVEHLNWRGLVYRFITTIIDDLFAFMVTMPTLRRLMYFRDDIIFVIYAYQRYIYRTDYSRKTVFTLDPQNQAEPPKPIPLKQD